MHGLLVILTTAFVLSLAAPARAETTPATGVAQLMVLEPGDASYKLFHGAVWLEIDKAKTNYRWGGLQCKGHGLSASSIQLLFAALRPEYQVSLEYTVNEYKGKPYRCVTGFSVSRS